MTVACSTDRPVFVRKQWARAGGGIGPQAGKPADRLRGAQPRPVEVGREQPDVRADHFPIATDSTLNRSSTRTGPSASCGGSAPRAKAWILPLGPKKSAAVGISLIVVAASPIIARAGA